MSEKNGGPAFPLIGTSYNQDRSAFEVAPVDNGMTLRDYFAAKAMQGFLASAGPQDGYWDIEAKGAYEVADAMLKARES